MNISSTLYIVRQCSECPGDAEYYCESCPCDLCPQCKEKHVTDLKTIDHHMVIYPEQFSCIPTHELCTRHPSNIYSMYCEPCEVPVCYLCSEHRTHRWMDLQRAYKAMQQQHRSEAPFTPSEVKLSFTDLFFWKESKLMSKPVKRSALSINQWYQKKPRDWGSSLTKA